MWTVEDALRELREAKNSMARTEAKAAIALLERFSMGTELIFPPSVEDRLRYLLDGCTATMIDSDKLVIESLARE